MPTYAYACTTCEHRFEVHQAFSDTSLTDCPECSGRLRKLFNTVGIVFKGSGFYRNDSRAGGSGSGERGDAGKDTGKDAGKGSDGSSDSGGGGKDAVAAGGTTGSNGAGGANGTGGANGSNGAKAAKGAGTAGSSAGAKTPAA